MQTPCYRTCNDCGGRSSGGSEVHLLHPHLPLSQQLPEELSEELLEGLSNDHASGVALTHSPKAACHVCSKW